MGQIVVPGTPPALILSAVDRLVASNADGGISPLASHVVLLGEDAGQNLGDVDFIYVIGAFSLNGGLANTVDAGSVIYGANILSALINSTPPINDGPFVAIGFNIAPAMQQRFGANVVIGDNIAHDAPALASSFDTSVVIGNEALEHQRILNANGGELARRSVIVGWRSLRGTAFTVDGAGTSVNESVFLGAESGEFAGVDVAGSGCNIEGDVAIGRRAFRNVVSGVLGQQSQGNVAIGFEVATQHRSGQTNVYVGASIGTAQTDTIDNVMVGANIAGAHVNNAGAHVVLGARASVAGFGSRAILIGVGANSQGDIGAGSDHLLVETVNTTTGVRRNLIYGNMGSLTGAVVTSCGIIFGLSGAANRDIPGMNIVKIIDGARDAGLTAPVGGGFLYSATGQLRWVDTAGTNHTLTTPVGGFLVAGLPAGYVGQREFVTNALAPAFGAAVAGGGGVVIPVFFNGAAWIVG